MVVATTSRRRAAAGDRGAATAGPASAPSPYPSLPIVSSSRLTAARGRAQPVPGDVALRGGQALHNRGGDGRRRDPVRIAGVTSGPDARLEPLGGERAVLEQAVLDREARPPDLSHGRLDHDVVAVAGRDEKARACGD